MERIYTIGYEGKTIEELLKILKRAKISIVIDVRENAASRKKGFSKKPLSEILNNNGIRYEHMIKLGTPKEIRLEYKKTGDINYLIDQYRVYLKENPEHIEYLLKAIGKNPTCLLCFEKLPTQCHRIVIAEELYLNQGMAINHL